MGRAAACDVPGGARNTMPQRQDHPATGSVDQALRQRARRAVPGGMTGHLNTAALPAGYAQFFQRGLGCRMSDVNGREVVDFMCAWGPNLLGWQHPQVQAALGDCLNGPTPGDRKSNHPSPDIVPAATLKTRILPAPPRPLGFTWS
jgi:4-aminobutyrate aminotransferase-like enzyme